MDAASVSAAALDVQRAAARDAAANVATARHMRQAAASAAMADSLLAQIDDAMRRAAANRTRAAGWPVTMQRMASNVAQAELQLEAAVTRISTAVDAISDTTHLAALEDVRAVVRECKSTLAVGGSGSASLLETLPPLPASSSHAALLAMRPTERPQMAASATAASTRLTRHTSFNPAAAAARPMRATQSFYPSPPAATSVEGEEDGETSDALAHAKVAEEEWRTYVMRLQRALVELRALEREISRRDEHVGPIVDALGERLRVITELQARAADAEQNLQALVLVSDTNNMRETYWSAPGRRRDLLARGASFQSTPTNTAASASALIQPTTATPVLAALPDTKVPQEDSANKAAGVKQEPCDTQLESTDPVHMPACAQEVPMQDEPTPLHEVGGVTLFADPVESKSPAEEELDAALQVSSAEQNSSVVERSIALAGPVASEEAASSLDASGGQMAVPPAAPAYHEQSHVDHIAPAAGSSDVAAAAMAVDEPRVSATLDTEQSPPALADTGTKPAPLRYDALSKALTTEHEDGVGGAAAFNATSTITTPGAPNVEQNAPSVVPSTDTENTAKHSNLLQKDAGVDVASTPVVTPVTQAAVSAAITPASPAPVPVVMPTPATTFAPPPNTSRSRSAAPTAIQEPVGKPSGGCCVIM